MTSPSCVTSLARSKRSREDSPKPRLIFRFDPFGFITQGDAGDLVEVGFFLHAAGVGKNQLGAHLQALHFQVRQWLKQGEAVERAAVFELGQLGFGARMQRQHHGQVLGDGAQCAKDAVQAHGVVGVFLPVKGAQRVALVFQAVVFQANALAGEIAVVQDGVVHHITDVFDALFLLAFIRAGGRKGKAFVFEVVHGGFSWAQQQR